MGSMQQAIVLRLDVCIYKNETAMIEKTQPDVTCESTLT